MLAETYIGTTFTAVLYISCICFLASCKKHQEMIVYGEVFDGNTNESISGIPITLSYSTVQNGVYSSGYSVLAKGNSDESGNYRLHFEKVSAVDYFVEVNDSQYFLYQEHIEREEWSAKDENRFDIRLFLATRLKLHIVNRSSTGNTLTLDLGNHSPDCLSCCPQEKLYFSGLVDTLIDCRIYGNQVIPYAASVINSLNASDISGEINLNHQTVEYEIEF